MSVQRTSETPLLPQIISQVFDRLMDDLHHHLHEAGYEDLRPTHCLNVLRIMDCDGTRPTELARRAGMTPQAMNELVSYLERRDYVRRIPDPVDRRGRVVVYADRGTAAAKVATDFFADAEARWDGIVGSDRFRDMKFALAEILDSTPAGAPIHNGARSVAGDR
ncbi:MarR family winged helix-turn-helix transcriptional regulator [Halostreptopolyspora alba]|uniref:MarR family transcriptional regulator n=1 Tax=Halostreptopolyspora alba TaxID=2487137 RepID=A0A3N0E4X3_9ACTN|nr:MarR family transcriptional regulator [Nocardiopsaceae bacterium YIM 96095]